MSVCAIDFTYDGASLSSKGYMICQFDGGADTISNGAEITFSEVPLQHGIKKTIAGVSYDTVITSTFSICKDFCNINTDDIYLSVEDVRALARWLQRKEYLPFVLLCDGYDEITYYGSFGIEQVRSGSNIIGLNLTLTTNSPFGWQEEVTKTVSNIKSFYIDDVSDEIGFLYPRFVITCNEAGDLTISNNRDSGNVARINGCSQSEVITIGHPIITTTLSSTHNIANDFNFIFPRIGNTYTTKRNTYTLSLYCDVAATYRPLAKIGV